MTNYFKLDLVNNISEGEWVQYLVEIGDAVNERDADNNFTGRIILKKKKRGSDDVSILDNGKSTPLSRRIVDGLKEQLNLHLASDGGNIAYAPMQLFTESDPVDPFQLQQEQTPASGIYGPSDVDVNEPAQR